ncbi:unnamed protein product [Heligmosomoides polygyrus]|uniref:CN hydrolase domain-containing protein n=1 Tax=Heligmosomoides polygyrus TaxID=6339 RepID=A0A183GSG1_HELPZ|nr:unnamed protein product [Heligmosomoides polygyrus]
MTDLSESLMISLTIARPKLPVDVVEMSACNNYRLICEILGFLIQTPFVGRLVDAIRSVLEDDYLPIAGDINGHVWSGRIGVERVHGGKGVGLVNSDGEIILDLAIAHDLFVYIDLFAKRESQKVTYASGRRRTELNHNLMRRPALKSVRDGQKM